MDFAISHSGSVLHFSRGHHIACGKAGGFRHPHPIHFSTYAHFAECGCGRCRKTKAYWNFRIMLRDDLPEFLYWILGYETYPRGQHPDGWYQFVKSGFVPQKED